MLIAPTHFRLNHAFDKIPASDFFHDLNGGLGIMVDAGGFTQDEGFKGVRYERVRKEADSLVIRVHVGRDLIYNRLRHTARAEYIAILRHSVDRLLERVKADGLARDNDLLARTVDDVMKTVERRRFISYLAAVLPT